jgi:flagellar assembly protein FliH/type III secretion protein L
MIPRARVLRAAEGGDRARALLEPRAGDAQRRRIARERIEATLGAERILDDARTRAEAILADARWRAEELQASATREAREEARAELAGRWLALRRAEVARFEKDADRLVPIAVALAERLLGAALELEPARVAELARGVLDEARGARRALIEAHPDDAAALRAHLRAAGLEVLLRDERGNDNGNGSGSGNVAEVEIRADVALARGDLRLHTDIGVIDARLAPRFERLAEALRDALP